MWLICVSSDIPATQKIGRFLGHMVLQGCSRCNKDFSYGEGLNFSGLDREICSLETPQSISVQQKGHLVKVPARNKLR